MPRSLLLAGVPLMVYALLGELLSCLGELLTEPLVALQLCVENRCSQPTGVHVALPVVSGDHATLTILVAASQQLVGDGRVDVRQQQCHRPAEYGVAGRVGTVGAMLLLLLTTTISIYIRCLIILYCCINQKISKLF